MRVHVGYTATDNTVPHEDSGMPTIRRTQSYTPTKPLQINPVGVSPDASAGSPPNPSPTTFAGLSAQPVGDEGGEADSGIPSSPASPQPISWAAFAEPAIWTALTPHEPSPEHYNTGEVYCCGDRFADWQAWREHVSPDIAWRLEKATLEAFPRK